MSAEANLQLPNNHPRPPSPLLPLPTLAQDDIEGSAPTVVESVKALLFSGYINLLLVAVPLSFISHFAKWGA